MAGLTVRQFLACQTQDGGGHLHRYLFDDNTVRYIEINCSHNDHFHNAPLPGIPDGNWNWAMIDRDQQTGQPTFQKPRIKARQGFTSTWNLPSVDHLTLQLYEGTNRHGRYTTCHDSPSRIFGCSIVVKIAHFDDGIQGITGIADIEKECEIYWRIQGQGIGPKFLGYVTEGNQKIGFVLEKFEEARQPESREYKRCKAVLKKLHRLEILHQDCHYLNVLVTEDRAVLIDFKSAIDVDNGNAVTGKREDIETIWDACHRSSFWRYLKCFKPGWIGHQVAAVRRHWTSGDSEDVLSKGAIPLGSV